MSTLHPDDLRLGKTIIYHDIVQNTPAWEEFRTHRHLFSATASECAALFGVSTHTSRIMMIEILAGRRTAPPLDPVVSSFGHEWEGPLAAFAAEVLGYSPHMVKTCGTFVNGVLAASPDRVIIPGIPYARPILMEVKARMGKGGYQTFPAYMVQMMVQMYCSGLSRCYLVHAMPDESIEIWVTWWDLQLWEDMWEVLEQALDWTLNPEAAPRTMKKDEKNSRSWNLLYRDNDGRIPRLKCLGRFEYCPVQQTYNLTKDKTECDVALLGAWRLASPAENAFK